MVSIKVKNLSKVFILNKNKRTTLKEKIIIRKTSSKEEYWALKNVNCQIDAGKTVGIIGRNGSGKSTLLKMMTKIMYPTKGSIEVNGKVSSLLELGAGFHPDFTGRENIYMNASILGFTKREIDKMVDDIIMFSELEDFIDNPLRSYSSGMYMRLAFSVAITVNPDILLIDEILSVGDTAFQRKCINRLKELKKQNKTIVIVSHDNTTLENMCDEVIWLKYGEVYKIGPAKEIIREYLDYLEGEEGDKHNNQQLRDNKSIVNSNLVQESSKGHVLSGTSSRWGNGKVRINGINIFNHNNEESYSFKSGDRVLIKVDYAMHEIVEDIVFGFMLTTIDGINCYGSNTRIDDFNGEFKSKGTIICQFDQLPLVAGKYMLDFAFHQIDGTAYDYYSRAVSIHVSSSVLDIGIAKIPHQWLIE
ncbi:ABC transporter ATP-binding protein [Paenibacillus lautus]|uniref:ABC transporter ATP-binding protein n=1 Tax=Paenibacillus lautus TaxID=1401 RepID=UPI002FBDC2E8